MFRQKLMPSSPKNQVTLARMVDLLFSYAASQGVEVAYEDISRSTGIAWNNVRKIRLGENTNPSLRTIQAIADYFGINLDYFNCKTEEECQAYLSGLVQAEAEDALVKMREAVESGKSLGEREALQALIDYVKRVEGLLPPAQSSTDPDEDDLESQGQE